MKLEYIKEYKKIRISGIQEYLVAEPTVTKILLFIDDVEYSNIIGEDSFDYTVTTDKISKVSLLAYAGSTLFSTIELGYTLTIEYSKDKNRKLMCSILDDRTHYSLSDTWIKRNKIIREIEYSFYSGNLKKTGILLKELKSC